MGRRLGATTVDSNTSTQYIMCPARKDMKVLTIRYPTSNTIDVEDRKSIKNILQLRVPEFRIRTIQNKIVCSSDDRKHIA